MNAARNMICVVVVLVCTVARGHPSRSAAVRDDGVVIVPDALRSVIWAVTPDGKVEALARDCHTHWLALGPAPRKDGSVYAEHLTYDAASESFPQSLVSIATDGERSTLVAPVRGASAFSAFVVRDDGAVLHAPESGAGRIVVRSPGGEAAMLVESTDAVAFGNVTAIARGAKGSIVFTDERGVFEFDAAGRVARRLEALPVIDWPTTNAPTVAAGEIWGIAADEEGGVFVAEPHSRRVWRVDEKGKAAIVCSSQSPWFPTGLAWGAGRLYVVEHGLWGDKNMGPRLSVVEEDGLRVIATISE